MTDFTHINEEGRARMVDISDKQETARSAIARTSVIVNEAIYHGIQQNDMKKGDVLSVAQVAGIMAAKNTSTIIPMCHPLSLTGVDLSFSWEAMEEDAYRLHITSEVKTKGSTGVEMEALTSASAAALTVYDMCKAVDKGITIGETYLEKKTGGKSGDYYRTLQGEE
ncbi:molybdenum cofactor biosynthesis protein C [Pontibacillus halophilus JSM 076056 = DSM 19796]|uniref:Cyclic pyranopterin monophosphate synthase n=1 Tax=Pontibacillus halophilus JSM 076056 = DSM 19796 TaxID=1385510 RepID=A0A0A5GAX3_9BACI|nr:cyclic pyranopterin monophosphate synthase MoaC [Pontibacillus halophilus]KGX88343.1 molybdenum cofactor biosynthesis protein C [Pontibacillus halophilus JSM 076056 = DSM 19796]